jgi:lipoprotein-anchoring transpeptidase ErfK/SrfK
VKHLSLALATALALGLSTASARADVFSLPWLEGDIAPPSWALSVHVQRGDEPLLASPFHGGARRGSAAREVLLPLFAARRGAGCGAPWYQVGPAAWVCGDYVDLSGNEPIKSTAKPFINATDGMPFRYYFVGPDGSAAYKKAEEVDVGVPSMNLEPGFAVAIVGERTIDGALYGMTEHGLWVPMRDLGPVHTFPFQGEALHDDGSALLPVAWVVTERAHLLSKPVSGAPTVTTKGKFDALHVLEEKTSIGTKFYRVGDGVWVKDSEVRHPTRSDPPPEVNVALGERWIDVDLATQTLVAYEGNKAVFATIVSTGKGKQGTALATPKGTHRIWIKLLTSDMDNLEDENAARYYRIENVPWVQYFSKGVGLHGAFWHRSFGHVRSHGCVNLTPADAQRLFFWTGPHLPAGWTAVAPTSLDQGTIIRVR